MTRTQFAALPLIGALLGQRIAAAPSVAAATSGVPTYVFARTEFVRRATLPYRHRQMFASRSLSGGAVLHLMRNSLKAYDAPGGFGDAPGTLHVAAVLYGTSLTALLTDTAWNDLHLAEFLQRLGDLPGGALSANPYNDVVAELTRANASFFVCNNALHDVAQALAAAKTGDSADDMYGALRRGLKREALVVPAGVAALNALAEYRFTLVQATV